MCVCVHKHTPHTPHLTSTPPGKILQGCFGVNRKISRPVTKGGVLFISKRTWPTAISVVSGLRAWAGAGCFHSPLPRNSESPPPCRRIGRSSTKPTTTHPPARRRLGGHEGSAAQHVLKKAAVRQVWRPGALACTGPMPSCVALPVHECVAMCAHTTGWWPTGPPQPQ